MMQTFSLVVDMGPQRILSCLKFGIFARCFHQEIWDFFIGLTSSSLNFSWFWFGSPRLWLVSCFLIVVASTRGLLDDPLVNREGLCPSRWFYGGQNGLDFFMNFVCLGWLVIQCLVLWLSFVILLLLL